MTRDELENYMILNNQINMKLRLLREIRSNTRVVSDSVKGSDKELPYTEHTIVIRGISSGQQDVSEEERKLSEAVDELIKERDALKQQIELFLRELPGDHRTILDLTYIKGWNQRKVGDVVGYSHTSVGRILKKY